MGGTAQNTHGSVKTGKAIASAAQAGGAPASVWPSWLTQRHPVHFGLDGVVM